MNDPDDDPGFSLRVWLVAAIAITVLAGGWSVAVLMGWLR